MIKTILDLKEQYSDYVDIYGKIKRDVDSSILFPVVKGIYETDINTSGHLLTAFIYGPSYLSFEYALSFHNLIPERVVNYTSATYNMRKTKVYTNKFGTFLYRDTSKEAYPYFIDAYIDGTYSYFIASKEKAICDMLYISPVSKNINELKLLLFEDLRINREIFENMNFNNILKLENKYVSKNIKLLCRLIEKEYL